MSQKDQGIQQICHNILIFRKEYFYVSFLQKTYSELFTITNGKHRLTVSAIKPMLYLKNENIYCKEKYTDSLPNDIHFDIFNNIGLLYHCETNGIREKIVFRDPFKPHKLSFLILCPDLLWNIDLDEQKIIFSDKKSQKEIFCIPAPHMYDSSNNLSIAVKQIVRKIEDGVIEVSIVGDSKWMYKHSDAIPITIERQYIIRKT